MIERPMKLVAGELLPLSDDEFAQWLADQAPPPPAPRIVSGAVCLALWTPEEIAAAIAADAHLLAGAFEALAQNSVNLDSPRTAALLALAVTRDVITEARRDQILAGEPPGE